MKLSLLTLTLVFALGSLLEPPLEGGPRSYDDGLSIVIKEMRDSIDDLRREISNHESEIHTFENRTLTQEESLEKLREEVRESLRGQKELSKTHQGTLEGRLTALESAQKGLIADLKQIKNSSNDSQELLKTFKDKIQHLDRSTEALSKNIEILQSAMQSIIESLKINSGAPSAGAVSASSTSSAATYKVKAGDSLEKIARLNHTTTKVLKELNGLTKDQITIGQTLKLPD